MFQCFMPPGAGTSRWCVSGSVASVLMQSVLVMSEVLMQATFRDGQAQSCVPKMLMAHFCESVKESIKVLQWQREHPAMEGQDEFRIFSRLI